MSGHRTSISLEREFVDALRQIAAASNRSMASIIDDIDTARGERNLSSAIRVWILEKYMH